mgnify:CR=1 FL=1
MDLTSAEESRPILILQSSQMRSLGPRQESVALDPDDRRKQKRNLGPAGEPAVLYPGTFRDITLGLSAIRIDRCEGDAELLVRVMTL